MNSIELAKICKVSKSTVSKKTAMAIKKNENSIDIGGGVWRFKKVGGRYIYEKVERQTLETKNDVLHRKYLTYPKEKRKIAEKRLELVRLYERRGNKSYREFIESLPRRFKDLKFSRRQFERWVKAVRDCPKDQTPLIYLVDKRGVTPTPPKLNEAMKKEIVKMIIEKPHRKIRRIHEYLKEEFSEVPSYETVRRWVEEWKSSHVFEWEFAKNPDKAKGKLKPAGGSMSESVSYPNALWELDATPADVICSDGKRYIISAAIDVYSRRPVVVVEESASYSTLAKLLRKAIKKLGVPDEIKVDNGKDYTSNYFDFTCARLRINKILVPPFSGEYKPHIERFFRTMAHELFEELPGYIGHNVSERSALASQQQFSKRLESIKAWREVYKEGNEFAKRFALKKENRGLEVKIPLSKEELELWIDKWIKRYENRVHGGIKTTPIKAWQRHLGAIRTISDERMLDILLGLSTMRTVRKKGIDWQGVTYFSPMFGDMVGQKVWVLSDDDMSRIYIYDLEMNFLFEAVNKEFVNVSRSDYLAATKRYNKRVAKIIKELETLRAEAPDRMMQLLDESLSKIDVKDIKSKKTKVELESIVSAAASQETEVVEDTKRKEEADIRINGRPIFEKFYDRFLWDLENGMVDEGTKRLAEKHEDIWRLAQAEYERRRA